MHYLFIDIETYSDFDIGSTGSWRYFESPEFEILLIAYSMDGEPVQVVDLAQGEALPEWFIPALTSPDVIKYAFNAAFEYGAFCRTYGQMVPEQWRDTMFHGMYASLPASLKAMGEALQLGEDKRKLTAGAALIRYFCQPCKPAKANGYRTRNYPHQDPDKWALFKEYNRQDVEAEMEIERRLSDVHVPPQLQKQWETDLRINQRGVHVDTALAWGALAIRDRAEEMLMEEAAEITGLENPNSTTQLRRWVNSQVQQDVEDMSKATVASLLKEEDLPDHVRRVLEIRQELGKTSTKKYDAVRDCTCDDSRVRGLLQFYGASRTGRWAGRLLQLQNLPRTYLKMQDLARDLVRDDRMDVLQLIFGQPFDTLAQLVRTVLTATPNKKLVDADFSAIEARVISWLAGEKWRLKAFEAGEDIYCTSASQMFRVPVEKHGVNSHLRSRGKVAELACIAEGSPVLTDHGLVPIERVTAEMRLWDGENWVRHDGVVCRGVRECIEYEGLIATTDHLVFIEGKSRPVQFGDAAASGAHLAKTGDGWQAIRLGNNNQPRKTMEPKLEYELCTDTLQRMRPCSMAELFESVEEDLKRMPGMFAATEDTKVAGSKTYGRKTTMRKPEGCRVQQLRRTRNSVRISECIGSRTVSPESIWSSGSREGDRQDRYERELRAGEYSLCDSSGKCSKSAQYSAVSLRSEILAIRLYGGNSETVARDDTRGNHQGCRGCSSQKEKELARYKGKTRVYDIRNAGRHHRFTVSGRLVHNCGYGGGASALIAMGALENGLTEEELPEIIDRWRKANPHIKALWDDFNRMAIEAVESCQVGTHYIGAGEALVRIYRMRFDSMGMDALVMDLPSGRKLVYLDPALGINRFGGVSISYLGVSQTTKKRERVETYGGRLVENVVQAIARDLLAEAIERLEAAGYPVVFHVHDEVVIDISPYADDKTMLADVVMIMSQNPSWCPSLPLAADGWVGDYFTKE